MARPKRREKEIEHTRKHIAEAAARVFAKKGYNKASMQEIASEAGFSTPSLYSYFDGKKAILSALLQQIYDEAEGLFEIMMPPSLSFAQRLELLLYRQAEWVDRHRDAFVLLTRREGIPEALDEVPTEDRTPAYVAQLTSWLQEHGSGAHLGGLEVRQAAYFLWGVSRALYLEWIYGSSGESSTTVVPTVIRLFFNGVSQPIATTVDDRE